MQRPIEGDYIPFFSTYINKVPEGNLIEFLEKQLVEMNEMFSYVSEEQGMFRYASDKWSIIEVLGHIIDAERIMSHRLFVISRGDDLHLPGFKKDLYLANAGFEKRPLKEIFDEFKTVRRATVALLKSLNNESVQREGIVSKARMTVPALAFIIVGHATHHIEILRERYLNI